MTTLTMKRLGVLVASLAMTMSALGSAPLAGPQTNPELMSILEEAQAAHLRGDILLEVDPEAARSAYLESADGWRRVLARGHQNGRLWTNLGNAELEAGRLGEAIAAYREADRLLPGDVTVRANLTEARNRVPASFDRDGVVVLYDSVSDGWHLLGFETRWWLAACGWVGFWGLLSVRLLSRRRDSAGAEGGSLAWRAGLTGLASLGILAGTTIALDLAEDAWRTPGVLLESTTVRSGNGETFRAVFSENLPAGVEFELLETRPGWHHVAFGDGRTGWVRSDHASIVGG